MLAERIWRAHEQGLINATDRDLRLQNVRHAHSMTEIDLMSRDLGQLEAAAAPPTLRQRLTRTHTSPATGRWDAFDPQARTRTLGAGRTALLAVLGVVLLMAGFGVAVFFFMLSAITGAVENSRSSNSSEAFEGTSRELAPDAQIDYGLTAAGLYAFIRAYEEKFGTTLVTDLALYDDYAVVRIPIPESALQRGWLLRRHGWTAFGPELDRFPGSKDVDLRRIDIPRLLDNIRLARETLGVTQPVDTWMFIRRLPSFAGPGRIDIHVSNAQRHEASLETTLDGRVLSRAPFTG